MNCHTSTSRLITQSGALYLRLRARATPLGTYQLIGTNWSASKTSERRYASRIAKTSATLEEKRRHAQLGGGQKRIDKQHATVSLNVSKYTRIVRR